MSNKYSYLFALLTALYFGGVSTADDTDWEIGPFCRPADAQPVITPNPNSVFDCPMRGKSVHWESTHTFNPAAIVKDDKIYILYRAEDDSGRQIGGFTSRLGLASSSDGIQFTRQPEPVVFPANDDQKDREWEGGCEDPRCIETEDGQYVLFYTQYHRLPGLPRRTDLGMAWSKDLVHWTKTGPVIAKDDNGVLVMPSKSASLLCAVRDGRLIAKKINGKYWLYYGEGTVRLMTSANLQDWTPVKGFGIAPRSGHFDSGLVECGPPALLTARGILLIYNGKNAEKPDGDPSLKPGVYSAGEVLLDATTGTHLLQRSETPVFKPEMPWEASGQYAAGTTFTEGLALFHNKWFLYYGCADSNVGVAVAAATGN